MLHASTYEMTTSQGSEKMNDFQKLERDQKVDTSGRWLWLQRTSLVVVDVVVYLRDKA